MWSVSLCYLQWETNSSVQISTTRNTSANVVMRPCKERTLLRVVGFHCLNKSFEAFLVQIFVVAKSLVATSLHCNQVTKLLNANLFMTFQLSCNLRVIRAFCLSPEID